MVVATGLELWGRRRSGKSPEGPCGHCRKSKAGASGAASAAVPSSRDAYFMSAARSCLVQTALAQKTVGPSSGNGRALERPHAPSSGPPDKRRIHGRKRECAPRARSQSALSNVGDCVARDPAALAVGPRDLRPAFALGEDAQHGAGLGREVRRAARRRLEAHVGVVAGDDDGEASAGRRSRGDRRPTLPVSARPTAAAIAAARARGAAPRAARAAPTISAAISSVKHALAAASSSSLLARATPAATGRRAHSGVASLSPLFSRA